MGGRLPPSLFPPFVPVPVVPVVVDILRASRLLTGTSFREIDVKGRLREAGAAARPAAPARWMSSVAAMPEAVRGRESEGSGMPAARWSASSWVRRSLTRRRDSS